MRLNVVSDVHGNAEALARAGDGADALLVLGDLIDFVDYHDHSAGILGRVFGAEKVRRFAELRAAGRSAELRGYSRTLWATLADPVAVIDEAVREQYARMFAVLPAPTYAIPGNVDVPALWDDFAREGLVFCDGRVVELAGVRIGMVGGGLLPPGFPLPGTGVGGGPAQVRAWRPYLRTDQDFGAATAALAGVDLLASHIPPALPELCYDVVARRFELGSRHLVEVIDRDRPALALFGHVHQPLAPRLRRGRTECENVGHFQRTGRPHVVRC